MNMLWPRAYRSLCIRLSMPEKVTPAGLKGSKWGAARQKLHERKLERIERQSASRRQSTKFNARIIPARVAAAAKGLRIPRDKYEISVVLTPRKGGFSPRKSLVLS